MKIVLSALLLVTLSGCFLNQHKPNPPAQPANGGLIGVVALEDFKGVESGTTFVGLFARKSDSARVVAKIESRPEQSLCEISRKPLAVRGNLISIGQLSIGTALQSTHLLVPEDDQHRYIRRFNPDFPAGTYEVSASGVSGIPAFGVYLKLPEALQDVSVNGQAFGSSSMLVRKSDPLIASWRSPTLPSSDQIVILDVETKSATEKIVLHCIALEYTLSGAGGSLLWQIPADKLTGLAEMKDADVYFSRGVITDIKQSYLDLQVQGLRTWFSKAEIGG